MPEPNEERDLVLKAMAGDASAFGEVYGRSWGPMYVYVAGRVADRDEARSLVQETFLQAWEGLSSLREPDAFPGFLRTIASRLVANHFRSPRARNEAVREAPQDAPDPGPSDPAKIAETRDLLGALSSALDSLEPVPRRALLLRYADGLKHREVAERLGLGLDQAAGLISRALIRLGERLSIRPREESR